MRTHDVVRGCFVQCCVDVSVRVQTHGPCLACHSGFVGTGSLWWVLCMRCARHMQILYHDRERRPAL
jgi:hypothetical protein